VVGDGNTPASHHREGRHHHVRLFGCGWWEVALAAVSRRPPISLYTIVARTRMYTHDAKVWELSIVHGPFL
jgi:hypothetical protein